MTFVRKVARFPIIAEVKDNITRIKKDLSMNSQRFAGVLAEDPNSCYAAVLQRVSNSSTGVDKLQSNAFATTVVKTKIIFLYRMGVYADPNTPDRLLARLKETVAALYAVNK